jgi:hypothetical protein
MIKKLLFALLFLHTLIVYGQRTEDSELYHTILKSEFVDHYYRVVIKDSTSIIWTGLKDSMFISFSRELPELLKETFIDFIKNNSFKFGLNDEFKEEIDIILLPDSIEKEIFNNDNGWALFYEKYKNSQGILDFSRAGFSNDKKQALIYYGNQSNWKSGKGFYVIFEKKDGKWIRINSMTAWES